MKYFIGEYENDDDTKGWNGISNESNPEEIINDISYINSIDDCPSTTIYFLNQGDIIEIL